MSYRALTISLLIRYNSHQVTLVEKHLLPSWSWVWDNGRL